MTIDITTNALQGLGVLCITGFGAIILSRPRTNRSEAKRYAWQAWMQVALAALAAGKEAPKPPSDAER